MEFVSPFGFLGKLVDFLFLKRYMKQFLVERNNTIKLYAESDRWKEVV